MDAGVLASPDFPGHTPRMLLLAMMVACDSAPAAKPAADDWSCELADGAAAPDSVGKVGCFADFTAIAANPFDASIPGAHSSKTVIDRSDDDHLYFTNTNLFPVHWDFASTHLSGNGLPIVPAQGDFNTSEYYSPDRRFILGAVTYYEEPKVWAYEISPYDTASVEMIAGAYRKIAKNAYFGDQLYFHSTSTAVDVVAADLPADIKQITTDELFAGITYQPLNLGTTTGQLKFYRAADLANGYANYREVVVLDEIPNDISVVAGIISDEFQTPLSHINVLSQNRGTPNMGLHGAFAKEELRALDGKWVELNVEAFDWAIREITVEEADAWWEANKPTPLSITPMDLSVTDMPEAEDLLDLDTYDLRGALDVAVPAFGGKASNMGGLVHIGDDVRVPDCFAIPVYYYNQHMEENGLWDEAATMLANPEFQSDAAKRAEMLTTFQSHILEAPMNAGFMAALTERITGTYGMARMRFRSSTNAEDLGNFTGAGLYTSESGDFDDPDRPVDVAIKTVWASIWSARAYEERAYWSIDHTQVGMALLVEPTFVHEEANGVAISGNIFDTSGVEPAFYINAQDGEDSVVIPEDGVTTDQILYYFDMPGQPVVYLAHSNQVEAGTNVLATGEIHALGVALDAIQTYFQPAYGMSGGFYAMDTEWKVERDADRYQVILKQARPYPGWNAAND